MQVIVFILLLFSYQNKGEYSWMAKCPRSHQTYTSSTYKNLEQATDSLHYFLDNVCPNAQCDTLEVSLNKNKRQVRTFLYVCLD